MPTLVFGSPWLLGFLVILPVIWWLVRLTPPAPKRIVFPALSLLRDIVNSERSPARTPWWLLLLRLFIASLLILGLAEPLLNPRQAIPGHGPVLIAIDNDWAAARNWGQREQSLHALIDQAEREQREIIFLPTTPPANGEKLEIYGPVTASIARTYATHLIPQPWSSNWHTAKALIQKFDPTNIGYMVWLSSGLGGVGAEDFANALQNFDAPKILSDAATMPLYLITPPLVNNDQPRFTIYRANAIGSDTVGVTALGADDAPLAQIPVTFASGNTRAEHDFDLPLDIRNHVTRLVIEGKPTAGHTLLLDERWRRRPVGLIGEANDLQQNSLLSELYYIDRALRPFVDLHIASLTNLFSQSMAVMIVTDQTVLSEEDVTTLKNWVQKGGILIRFAGEQLATTTRTTDQDLLPVSLLKGERALGGTMSWATPQKLRPFPAISPFHNITIPPDVNVNRQLLAEPTVELNTNTWAMLQDGTPLVTAKSIGKGFTVLFHVPARAEWSNLPISGLFIDMLRRIVDLSNGVNLDIATNLESQPPQQILNAFGALQNPSTIVQPLHDATNTPVDPQHPPGLYGPIHAAEAFNLGQAIAPPVALNVSTAESYQSQKQEANLQALLLTFAFLLLLGDFLLSLWLRGLITIKHKVASLLFFTLLISPAHATAPDAAPIEFTGKTYLAYIVTSNRTIDAVSAAGLSGLARQLEQRTAIDKVGVIGVDPATDELSFFPFLYWPLNDATPPPTPKVAAQINDYLRRGGMILFDTGQGPQPTTAPPALTGIHLPPLIRMPEAHVLKHSFYLLDDFPGRFNSTDIWIEPEQSAAYDGVASVLIGDNDWAAAWATDPNGQPQFACVPGGELQRERAYRFGINLVMYALTGNYKADQMHAKALLERTGK